MSKLPLGFSLQINGGSYGGFHLNPTKQSWRLALGWISISLFFYDVEPVIHNLVKIARKHDHC